MPDLDELPFIDREVFGKEETSIYRKLFPEPFATFHCSEGCPYHCSFCQPAREDLIRSQGPEQVPRNLVEELVKCRAEDGILSYLIHDDCLLWNMEWIEEFIRLLERRKIGLPFAIQSRADLICRHPDAIRALASVGLRMILVGFESGSQRILDLIQKGTTVEQNLTAARICQRPRGRPVGQLHVRDPGEEKEDVVKTVEMVRTIKPEVCSPAFFTPYPGSFLGDDCHKRHLSLIKDKEGFRRNPYRGKIKGIDYRYLRRRFVSQKGKIAGAPI